LGGTLTKKITQTVTYHTYLVLKLFGYPVSQSGCTIYFDSPPSQIKSMIIGPQCAGVVSQSLFLLSFALMVIDVRDRIIARRLPIFLALGSIGTYTANIFRLVILAVVGFHKGIRTMYSVHDYLGYILFLGWIALFWLIAFRLCVRKSKK